MVREVGMKTMRLSKQNAMACKHARARHTNARVHAVVAAICNPCHVLYTHIYIACKWRVVSNVFRGWVITVFMQHSIKTLLLLCPSGECDQSCLRSPDSSAAAGGFVCESVDI